MKWLLGLLALVAVLAGLGWYAAFDAAAPAEAPDEFDVVAYRQLLVSEAPETLPTDVRVEFVGSSEAPSFAAEAGAFGGQVAIAYTAFQIIGPTGNIVIDGAVDADTVNEMTDGEGSFSEEAYERLLGATAEASHVLITHEHLDHVMAVVRHPEPDRIAPHLRLTRQQMEALPQHARGGVLPPAIAGVSPVDFSTPTRVAPGVVAHAAPGHTPGTIVVFVRTQAREYLLVGDIVWVRSSIDNLRGRPRFIQWMIPEVDPDRPAVLRQIRALHDLSQSEPDLVILPAHDEAYLRRLITQGVVTERFAN